MLKKISILAIFTVMLSCSSGTEPEGSRGPAECMDNFDNDQDGLIDCADPDCCALDACSAAPECTSTDTSSTCGLYNDIAEMCDYTSYGECNHTYCSALELDILVASLTCDLAQENPCAANSACKEEDSMVAVVGDDCIEGIIGISNTTITTGTSTTSTSTSTTETGTWETGTTTTTSTTTTPTTTTTTGTTGWSDNFESASFGSEWSTSGDADWVVTSSTQQDGIYSAECGSINSSQSTSLSVTLFFSSAGSITFWHKESSEFGYDYLTFYIDGSEYGSWSGENGWSDFINDVSPGTHTLTWTYSKDDSISDGLDSVWIDVAVATNGGLQ